MSGKPVVFVIGASGSIGNATLQSLSSMHAKSLDIKAGVRDPTKAEALKSLPGVTVVKATMGETEMLERTLRGVDRLFIVTPGIENRTAVTIATANIAKEAGVKHILVVSVMTAYQRDTGIFGAQFFEIESAIKTLGIPFTIIRLPIFVDNNLAAAASIKSDSAFYLPFECHKNFTPVVVQDAGNAAAAILADPAKHAGKTYHVVGQRHSLATLAATLSTELGRPIKHVQVPYEAAKKALLELGFQEWQSDGLLELYKLIDEGSAAMNYSDPYEYETITGQKPTTLQQWVQASKAAFQ